jgi:hypothetical protein
VRPGGGQPHDVGASPRALPLRVGAAPAFAAGEADVLGQDWLWSRVAFTVVVASVLIHGVLSRPLMEVVHPQNRETGSKP